MAREEVLSTYTPNEGREAWNANDTELYARDATFTVASEAAMIALSAKKGDIARRTDLTPDAAFRLSTDDPTLAANWVQISGFGGAGVTDHGALTGLADDDHTQYQLRSEKDQNSGYAGLNSSGRVPISRIATGTPDGTKFVRDDGTLAVPSGGGGGHTLVTLGSDVVNNNASANTLQDVTGLSFSAVAGTTYRIFALIMFDSAASTTGSRWTINGPTTSGPLVALVAEWTSAASTFSVNTITAFDAAPFVSAGSLGTAGNLCRIMGVIKPGASGTVVVRFASEVSGSAITAKAGSVLEYW